MDESKVALYPAHRFISAGRGKPMTGLAVGQKAPDFELPRDGGGAFRLADHKGKPVVVYFYPQDDTETCTAEAIDFSTLKPEFDAAGVALVGISPDSAAKHEKFRKKYKLAHYLAADEEQTVLNAYGVWGEKTLFGRQYMGVVRTTFLIGRDGKVAHIWEKVRVKGHAKAVLEAASAL
jgi:thioredoxin-dependent peroxiredoxin